MQNDRRRRRSDLQFPISWGNLEFCTSNYIQVHFSLAFVFAVKASLFCCHIRIAFFCFSDSCHEARKKEGSRLFLYCLFISKMIPSEKEVEKLMDTSESCWVKCHFSYLVFQFIFDKMNNEWNGRTVVDRKT